MTLSIDVETYSSVDLKVEGVHKYVQPPDFQIMLFAYKFEGEETQIVDFFQEDLPDRVYDALTDPEITKTAFNANFEIEAIEKHFEITLDRTQWQCTMILSSMCGYPLKLESVAKAMKLTYQKDRNGTALIKLFSTPNKVRGRDEYERIYPNHYPLKWLQFKDYCVTDVNVEDEIRKKLHYMKPKPMERELWILDNKINRRGIKIDFQLVANAISLKDEHDQQTLNEAIELTGLANPNSTKQLKEWLEPRLGYSVNSLSKEWITEMLQLDRIVSEFKQDSEEYDVRRLLELRQEMSKSSLEKYETMLKMADEEGIIRYLFQLYGATKTGRWAGRGVQVQNLTHTKLNDLSRARQLLLDQDIEAIKREYGKLSHYLSMLIRTAFVARKGEFTISDFSAIEARITAWYANEKWRLDVFNGDGKIYEASAAMMFKIPIEQVDKDMRSKGKVAELALGYQGSVGAMERMGAYKMGLKREELKPIVDLWRYTSPRIVKLWDDVNTCALLAIKNPGQVFKVKHLKFFVRHDTMFLQLPSGRFICYVHPRLGVNKFGDQGITYWGLDQKTNQWSIQETYGGKLVENIVQGTARDVLAAKMLHLDREGFDIVMHVHDEVVAEDANPEEMTRIMELPLDWAPGLPLRAATFTSPFYLKD